jgi:hypothetical protein
VFFNKTPRFWRLKIHNLLVESELLYVVDKTGSNSFFALILPYSKSDFFSFFVSIFFALK